MLYSKGNIAQLKCGHRGEITETWGFNQLFLRVRSECGKVVPAMEKDVESVTVAKKKPTWGGGKKK